MDRLDYWKDGIANAAEECGAFLTPEQLAYIAKAVDGGHEEIGQAFPVPESPYPGEIARLESALRTESALRGCPDCRGSGRQQYMAGPWHCDSQCDTCHGKGKI